ncbi:DUF6264 family protein [Herbiconiux sp. 11R-BC]|uniref:DUF6264 family protein n=1 Tax=Herbiconiux sp. 11R-BC TaxID=3111637 RepID=UPI003BFBA4F7
MTDERPKPKYGELAPEGWVWQPPQQAAPDADEPASPAPAAAAPPARGAQAPGAAATPHTGLGFSTGDVVATVILLAIGLYSTLNSIVGGLLNLPALIQPVIDAQGLGVTYTATSAASVIGTIGAVVLALIYALAVWASVVAIRKHKRAVYIPLACAVLSFIALVFVLVLAIFADGALVNAMLASSGV